MEDDLYLSLMAGRDPATTRTVFISRDPELLRAVGRAIRERIERGLGEPGERRALSLLEEDGEEEETHDGR